MKAELRALGIGLAAVFIAMTAEATFVHGRLVDAGGTPLQPVLIFWPMNTPLEWQSTNTVMDVPKTATVTNGEFTVFLVGGFYMTESGPFGKRIRILVPPDDPSTYEFNYCAALATNINVFSWASWVGRISERILKGANMIFQTNGTGINETVTISSSGGGGGSGGTNETSWVTDDGTWNLDRAAGGHILSAGTNGLQVLVTLRLVGPYDQLYWSNGVDQASNPFWTHWVTTDGAPQPTLQEGPAGNTNFGNFSIPSSGPYAGQFNGRGFGLTISPTNVTADGTQLAPTTVTINTGWLGAFIGFDGVNRVWTQDGSMLTNLTFAQIVAGLGFPPGTNYFGILPGWIGVFDLNSNLVATIDTNGFTTFQSAKFIGDGGGLTNLNAGVNVAAGTNGIQISTNGNVATVSHTGQFTSRLQIKPTGRYGSSVTNADDNTSSHFDSWQFWMGTDSSPLESFAMTAQLGNTNFGPLWITGGNVTVDSLHAFSGSGGLLTGIQQSGVNGLVAALAGLVATNGDASGVTNTAPVVGGGPTAVTQGTNFAVDFQGYGRQTVAYDFTIGTNMFWVYTTNGSAGLYQEAIYRIKGTTNNFTMSWNTAQITNLIGAYTTNGIVLGASNQPYVLSFGRFGAAGKTVAAIMPPNN